MIGKPNLVHKTLLESLFSTHFNEIKSHFKNFAAQHARREAFFLNFFTKNGYTRDFSDSFQCPKRPEGKLMFQSHLE